MSYFKFGLVAHLAVGLFTFSNSHILSPTNQSRIKDFEEYAKFHNIHKKLFLGEEIFERFENGISLMYLVFVLFLLSAYLIKNFATGILLNILQVLFKYFC